MTKRLSEQWVQRDYPVLREVVRLMDANPIDVVRATQVEAALVGTHSEDEIQAAAVALQDAGYVRIEGVDGVPCVWFKSISERARRATGVWPSHDTNVDELLAFLDQQTEAAPPEEQPKRRRIRDAIGDAGTDLAAKVVAELIARQAGI